MSNPARKQPAAATRPRGPYREPTTPVRIPRSLLGDVAALLAEHRQRAQTKSAA